MATAGLLALALSALASPCAAAHADGLAAIQERVTRLRHQGRFQEALRLKRLLVARARQDTNVTPTELVDAEWEVRLLERVSGLTPSERRQWVLADSLDGTLNDLMAQGRVNDAVAAARRVLEIQSALVGETLPEVAMSMNNLGLTLQSKGDMAAAEPLYRRALEVQGRLLGAEHPDIALTLGNLAGFLVERGDLAAAEPYHRQALAVTRRLHGDDGKAVATQLNNYASFLQRKGDYAAAEPVFREALASYRRLLGPEHTLVATCMNNLAHLLQQAGNLAAAEPLYRESLAMRRKLEGSRHSDVAVSLNNLSVLAQARGDYLTADSLAREALDIWREQLGGAHPSVATSLNNLAQVLARRGDHAAAESVFRETLAMWRTLMGSEHPNVATTLSNLGFVLEARGQGAAAESLYREALAMQRKLLGDDHPDVGRTFNNLATLLQKREDLAAAEPVRRQSLDLWRRSLGDQHPSVAKSYESLGHLLLDRGDLAGADSVLTLAAQVYEGARLRVGSGIDRATFQRSPYAALAHVRLERGRGGQAWPAAERDRGRALADLLFAARQRPLTTLEASREDSLRRRLGDLGRELRALQRAARRDTTGQVAIKLDATRGLLVATEAEWSRVEQEIAERHPLAEGQPFPLERVQATLGEDAALIGWLDETAGRNRRPPWGYVIRKHGPVQWVALPQEPVPGYASVRARLLRAELAWPQVSVAAVEREAQALFQSRVEPLMEALRGIKDLIVLPSSAMLGVPLEALVDRRGRTLGERFAISYAPSATLHAWLTEDARSRAGSQTTDAPGAALLVGDPPFTNGPRALMAAGDSTALASARLAPDSAQVRGALRGNAQARAWLPPLPGSRAEVRNLAALWPGATVLLGADASEPAVARAAASGELRKYRAIHFATHALVDDDRPENSALVLAQTDLPDALAAAENGERIFDGLVSAEEILREWKLEADLVTLSACETGLGRAVAGEGYIGFAHAFLQAGAHSLLVSLWKVDDRATALLMTRFYQNWIGRSPEPGARPQRRPMSKANALREAKSWLRAFRDGHGNRPFAHPYFWSAFILMGDRS